MIFTKDLILKGVAGLAAIGGLGAGGFYVWNQNQEESLQSLAEKVGLNCTGTPTVTEGVGCEIKEDGGLNAKQDPNKQTGKKKSNTQKNNAGTIKAYKVEASGGQKGGFKFVIEEEDIELTNGVGTNISKLEEFETYEIEEDGGTHYLTRKTKVSDKIEADLALPAGCKLSGCSDVEITASNVGAINFVGRDASNQPQLTSGNAATVTVTKETSNSDFPYGYKFSLKGKNAEATITIGSTSYPLKQNQATEFRIKKTGTGNSTTFSLEKTWTLETLTEKVGLECTAGATPTATTGVECTKKADSTTNIKVKQDDTTFDLSAISGGKIKVYKAEASENYNQDLKFVIEDNDISGTGGKKLEQFETYEIKKDGNEWRLVRKNESWKEKRKLLGIPQEDGCKFPDHSPGTTTCVLTETQLKAIKFEDKGSGDLTLESSNTPTLKLKISITTDDNKTDYPLGYKFVLESNRDIGFTETSKSIKKNTNTEFKIKKAASGNALTLEKAWTVTTLAAKAGLNCPAEGNTDKTCTLNESGINVHNGNNKYSGLSKKAGNEGKKIKYEEDAGDHNQGIKFYVEGSDDICLNGSSGDDANKKIEKKTGGGGSGDITYEIKKSSETSDNNWYLTKKSQAGVGA